jgi:hypothetical protein
MRSILSQPINVNQIIRSNGHVYQIKSNTLSSMGVAGSQANFTGKASIQDITDPLNPISIDGNATLQLWMTDNFPGLMVPVGNSPLHSAGHQPDRLDGQVGAKNPPDETGLDTQPEERRDATRPA